MTLQRHIAELTNAGTLDNELEAMDKPKSKKGRKAQKSSQAAEGADIQATDKIRQLGGKFAIMYMLWLGNAQAAFQTKLDPTFQPMDRFRTGLEWKRQGELADLLEVFPEEFHREFSGDFIHPIVGHYTFLLILLLKVCYSVSL